MLKREIWKKALVGSVAAVALGGFVSSALAKDKSFAPFERVATLDVVYNDDGTINDWASYVKGQEVGVAITNFIANTNEATELGYPTDWIVAGDAMLDIPSMQKVVKPDGTKIAKKVQVIEICNKAYAQKALGVTEIIPGVKLPNGYIHAPALPCEISVHYDGDKIHVNMLNAQAIFTLFFTDVVTSELMLDPAFAEQMENLTVAVKSEMRGMILAGLAGYDDTVVTADMAGPIYKTVGDAVSAVAHTLNQSPYVHYTYAKADGTALTGSELGAIVTAVTNTMTINGTDTAGDHDDELDALLSAGSLWRAARALPLGLPDGSKVVEPCSPTYAKMAISTDRLDHAPALPCEIAFRVQDGQLMVSYLDPNFMFDIMFGDMSDEEKVALGDLPGTVLNDLQTIVDYTIENKLGGLVLNGAERVYYDMLLEACDVE